MQEVWGHDGTWERHMGARHGGHEQPGCPSPAVLRPQGCGGWGGPASGAQPASRLPPLGAGSPPPPAAAMGASQLRRTSLVAGGASAAAAAAATGAGGAAGVTGPAWPSTSSSMLLPALLSGRKVSDWLRPAPPCCTLPLPGCGLSPAAGAAAAGCCCCGCSCCCPTELQSDLAPERRLVHSLPAAAGRSSRPPPPLLVLAAVPSRSCLEPRRRGTRAGSAGLGLPEASGAPGSAAVSVFECVFARQTMLGFPPPSVQLLRTGVMSGCLRDGDHRVQGSGWRPLDGAQRGGAGRAGRRMHAR